MGLSASGDRWLDHSVVAAGVWSEALLRPLGGRGHTPGKGYGLTVSPAVPPSHVLRLRQTHVGVTPLGERARPLTPDGKPLIGCVPGAERVVVATGHNMLGLTLGAATGTLVADLVERGPAAALTGFDPMRFTRRRLRAGSEASDTAPV